MFYSPGRRPHQAFEKAQTPPYNALVCEYSLIELRNVVNRKFLSRFHEYELFLKRTLPRVELVPVPKAVHPDEEHIRNIKDRPILRSAIHAKADILLSGDKDFLESGLTTPKIMSATDFLALS